MAITIFHKVINNNKIVIINKGKKQPNAIKVKGDVRVNRHTMSEVKTYD